MLRGWLDDNKIAFTTDWLNSFLKMDEPGILGDISTLRGDYYDYGSPVWADVREHEAGTPLDGFYQIFGHTNSEQPIITSDYAMIGCNHVFELDLDTRVIRII